MLDKRTIMKKGTVNEIIDYYKEPSHSLFTLFNFSVFVLCVGLGLAALTVSGILFTRSSNGSICNTCPGVLSNGINTDNGLLTINNNVLNLKGKSGIKTTTNVLIPNEITIDNLRDISPYTVSGDGGSEYLTPQAAYNAAIADGRGGIGLPAAIIMAPGIYDFGDTQFQITTPGISFVSYIAAPGTSGTVIFTANSTTGGINVNIPLDLSKSVIFQGITFGAVGDHVNGFLLNHTNGQCTLYMCAAQNSNFRIVTGGGSDMSILASFGSSFNTIPPNDFITTVNANTVLFLDNTQWTQLGFFTNVTNGGYIFNLYNGISEARMVSCHIVFDAYNAVFKGPAPGVVGQNSISFDYSKVIINDGNPMSSFLYQSGPCNTGVGNSALSLIGPMIYQSENSNTGEYHTFYLFNSLVTSHNSTILYDSSVNITGNCDYSLLNSVMFTTNEPLLINIPSASSPDIITVTMSGNTIKTTGVPLSTYAQGPDPSLATINVGTCTSINGGNNAVGFAYVPLTTL